jgi:hypothetical protein
VKTARMLQRNRTSAYWGASAALGALIALPFLTLACMGLFLSSLSAGGSSFFFVSFFVRSGARFFAPTHKSQTLSRAGAVKVGRHAKVATRSHHRQAIP